MSRLRILAEGRWPDPEAVGAPDHRDALPPLAGFTASSFNPLVAETAERCLRSHFGPAEARGPVSSRTALLLASGSGDLATALAIDTAAASGQRVPPLLFFQSNPNAVLGLVAARWRLTGPVVAVSPVAAVPGEVPPDALDLAKLLLADGDADQVLVIGAEQTPRTDPGEAGGPTGRTDPSGPATPSYQDRAVALLVTLA
ncbi:hypothetical protein [Kitasatospora sp. NPDC057015]|uniref:hypothetical protein n=1 Tax=Kitasatospora sp. NPDC057015 TaxID=3346001 RepID=UPI0036251E97